MTNLWMEIEKVVEGRVVYIAEHPIPFEDFVELAEGHFVELIDGVIVELPADEVAHEFCAGWLSVILGVYCEERGLGQMLKSRVMVKVDDFGGRMPDLLFIRQERSEIAEEKYVRAAPDLVMEIVSPNDRPSDLRALEADYARLGVPELVFIDLRTAEIRLLHLQNGNYDETKLTSGPVTFTAIEGLTLQAEWILREPRPNLRSTLNALLS